MKKLTYITGLILAIVAIVSIIGSTSAFAKQERENENEKSRNSVEFAREQAKRFAVGIASSTDDNDVQDDSKDDDRRNDRNDSKIKSQRDQGEKMIDQRIDSLEKIIGKIEGMKRISDENHSMLEVSVKSEIAKLLALKSQIASTSSTSTLQQQLNSITRSYRTYALVVPQAQIVAAADRVLAIVDSLNVVYAKVNARIATSSLASSTALANFSLNLNDATSQAKTAIALVKGLKPDNGDSSIATANKKALQTARQAVVAAQKSLQQAEKSIRTVIGEISHNKKSINTFRSVPLPATTTPVVSTSTATTTPVVSTSTTVTATTTTSTTTATTTP